MSDAINVFRLWCETEEQYVVCLRYDVDGIPTACPNNTSHIIDTDSITVERVISSYDVAISSVDESVTFTEKQVGFRDLSGHNLWVKGFLYTVTAGQDMEFSEKYSSDLYIQGGKVWTDGNASVGDYLELSVTDEDNLLGYGSGFQLVKFVENLYTHPDFRWECCADDVKLIPAGFYTTLRYYSTGSSDVKVSIAYRFRTV